MRFRRGGRFADVIRRQLDLFEEDESELIADCDAAERRYVAAERDEAEELYGDYLDLVAAGTEALAELRDTYASRLDEEARERYENEFNRAVLKRLPRFALDLDTT